MSSAGPSRPRVVTLTADQLLGTSLTPTRPHNKHKNSSNTPRVLTIEDLLGSGLTVARPSSRPVTRSAPRAAPRPSSSRASGSSSARNTPNPRLVRVTADEVLRTGIPVRTLQAVKARSQVLSAEELLATPSSRTSTQPSPQSRGRAAVAQSGQGSSRGGGSSGLTATGASAGRSAGGPSVADGTRSATQHAGRNNEALGHSQSRNPRAARRSTSLGSMRTLPIYTQEPGDSEVVIDRGATELEDDDEIPITVMSPVDESEPNGDNPASAGPTSSPPGSPSETEGASSSRQLSPGDAMSPVASSLPNDLTPLPPWTSIYADAAPSYEAAMSTPNLHIYRERQDNVPLPPLTNPAFTSPPISNATPASPIHASTSSTFSPSVSSPGSPVLNANTVSASSSPGTASPRPTVRVVTPQAPSATRASPGSRSPASPSSPSGERGDGAETPRRRFGFMSLFHSRSSSRLRARSHSHSSAQAPSSSSGSGSVVLYLGRVASPDLLSPRPTRPFHRFSQSASGSMLNLSTCSRADN